jgi:hypothetical protein
MGVADVVGNDGAFGLSGHVALYDGQGAMLEVYQGSDAYSVNGSCVHVGRSLEQFKQDVTRPNGYWGARYDRRLSSPVLARIYDRFLDQGRSGKATYSLWLPALRLRTSFQEVWVLKTDRSGRCVVPYEFEKKVMAGPAILRCDFTVGAVYREEAGVNLAGGMTFTPYSVFGQVPDSRSDVPSVQPGTGGGGRLASRARVLGSPSGTVRRSGR